MISLRISSAICRQIATPLFLSIRLVFAFNRRCPIVGRLYSF
ncbi:Hypothetical protein, conserved [Brucella abortus str. 2308 A]|nr:hypothetical protein BCA52141_I3411 [Brucella canis HSK A52141]AIB17836.1 Hypothetical protein BSSP3_I1119 [Brucella suis bv. 2]EEP63032.1 Hypothetical protein, conserved [Brucella abortus str. 2308 A]AIB20710.1 Hypothetical protein BSPT1_I0608 [Brucella suis bv. 2]AIB27463.1 Hypothetical protein BSSP1_I0598 [Brucella suis bv. 2]